MLSWACSKFLFNLYLSQENAFVPALAIHLPVVLFQKIPKLQVSFYSEHHSKSVPPHTQTSSVQLKICMLLKQQNSNLLRDGSSGMLQFGASDLKLKQIRSSYKFTHIRKCRHTLLSQHQPVQII